MQKKTADEERGEEFETIEDFESQGPCCLLSDSHPATFAGEML